MRFLATRMLSRDLGVSDGDSSGYLWLVVDTEGYTGNVWAVCTSEGSAETVARGLNTENP